DLPVTRARLGCALARAGRTAEAVEHLRVAVEGNPFDAPAARALYQALVDSEDRAGAEAVAAERRLLAAAAPREVPLEPWFSRGRRTRVAVVGREEFTARFGDPDTSRALCGYTPVQDTHVVLSLLTHVQPRRVLEVGTALGHMTANLTEWSPDDA